MNSGESFNPFLKRSAEKLETLSGFRSNHCDFTYSLDVAYKTDFSYHVRLKYHGRGCKEEEITIQCSTKRKTQTAPT